MPESPGRAFGQAVAKYKDFRPRPPSEIFEIIATAVGEPRERVADLGAGTGHGTEPLLSHFKSVTAVEIDPVMAAELEGLSNDLTVIISPAEDVDFESGSLDLVTACMSFHWMDRDTVSAKVANWLRPGGIFALYGYGQLAFPDSPALHDLIEEEKHTRWTHFFPHEQRSIRHEDVLAKFPILKVTKEHVPHFVPMTAEQLTGHMASTSTGGAWARSTGDVEGYWRDFKARLLAIDTIWPTRVDFSKEIILARKEAS